MGAEVLPGPAERAPGPRAVPVHAPTPAPGQQADFEITPDGSRKYQVATFGTADTTLVLFEEDSGEERDFSLSVQLFRGEEVRRARQAGMGRTARTHRHHVLVAQRVLHPVP
ncbi:hypothetical protein [Kocuria rhizosphaericola]|uniref:hypothetical protein n=1 Tax=Kocuria rhizosphaericola TaxID=3376284 RepID=UPI003795D7CE